ncbi:MAG TPA: hypothetical protein VK906_04940 [Egicoccus sp.]|nr:hypothetical protein [Egicoccus sp.]HSK22496.1 hypothetical protein [Egicoccus sp.]
MNATAGPTAVERGAARQSTRRHLVLRHRLRIDGAGLPLLATGLFVAALTVTAAVSLRVDIRISGWDVAAQVARWFIGAIGVHLSAVYLPLYVTHGVTRRRAAADTAVFAGVYALLAAVLVALGFLLERLVYRLAGWEQRLDAHLFDTPGQVHLVVLEYGAVFLVWLMAGALLGAGFYRRTSLGFVLIPPALGAAVLLEAGIGGAYLAPPPVLQLGGLLDLGTFGPWQAVGTAIVLGALLGAATWLVVRDVPIRNQAT